jgi:hypothetical protein
MAFDRAGALAAGYSNAEIDAYLAGKPKAAPAAAPAETSDTSAAARPVSSAKSPIDSVLDPLKQGASGFLKGLAATDKQYIGAGYDDALTAAGEHVAPTDYKPAEVLASKGADLPKAIGEAAPGMGAAVLAARLAGRMHPALGVLAAGGTYAASALGNRAEERAAARTGDDTAQPTPEDKRIAATAMVPEALIGGAAAKVVGNPVRSKTVRAALSKGAGTVGVEAGAGAAQNTVAQVGRTVDTDTGSFKVDPEEVAESGIVQGATGGALRAPAVARGARNAARYGGFDPDSATRVANDLTAVSGGDMGRGGKSFDAVTKVEGEYRVRLADAVTQLRQEAQLSPDARVVIDRVRKGQKLNDDDFAMLQAEVAGTRAGPLVETLVRDADTLTQLKQSGDFDKVNGTFRGGLGNFLEKRVRPLTNPTNAAIGGGAAYALGGAAPFAASPAIAAGAAGVYGGARLLDRAMGSRLPAKGFAEHFAGPAAARPGIPPPPAPAVPPQAPPRRPGPTGPQVRPIPRPWGNAPTPPPPPAPGVSPTMPWGLPQTPAARVPNVNNIPARQPWSPPAVTPAQPWATPAVTAAQPWRTPSVDPLAANDVLPAADNANVPAAARAKTKITKKNGKVNVTAPKAPEAPQRAEVVQPPQEAQPAPAKDAAPSTRPSWLIDHTEVDKSPSDAASAIADRIEANTPGSVRNRNSFTGYVSRVLGEKAAVAETLAKSTGLDARDLRGHLWGVVDRDGARKTRDELVKAAPDAQDSILEALSDKRINGWWKKESANAQEQGQGSVTPPAPTPKPSLAQEEQRIDETRKPKAKPKAKAAPAPEALSDADTMPLEALPAPVRAKRAKAKAEQRNVDKLAAPRNMVPADDARRAAIGPGMKEPSGSRGITTPAPRARDAALDNVVAQLLADTMPLEAPAKAKPAKSAPAPKTDDDDTAIPAFLRRAPAPKKIVAAKALARVKEKKSLEDLNPTTATKRLSTEDRKALDKKIARTLGIPEDADLSTAAIAMLQKRKHVEEVLDGIPDFLRRK